MAKKKHQFKASHMTHHGDGSITVHHEHESDHNKDVTHAVPDLDAAHDSMESNLGAPAAPAAPAAAPGMAGAPPMAA
jgi:hypothetical protein